MPGSRITRKQEGTRGDLPRADTPILFYHRPLGSSTTTAPAVTIRFCSSKSAILGRYTALSSFRPGDCNTTNRENIRI